MKIIIFHILVLLSPILVYADNYIPVRVRPMNENIDVSALTGPHKNKVIVEHSYDPSDRPTEAERDKVFTAVDIQDNVSSFDAFARDEIFSRAGYFSVEELQSAYKSIPRAKLESLRMAVLEWKKLREAKP